MGENFKRKGRIKKNHIDKVKKSKSYLSILEKFPDVILMDVDINKKLVKNERF